MLRDDERTLNQMQFIFNDNLLPEVYNRDGKKYYLDPVRKKLILITPEETVRQEWLSFILKKMKVPEKLIAVEEHLSHYGIKSKRRADIIIEGIGDNKIQYPICIVECKAPDVPLTERTQKQIFNYCDEVYSDYAIMSNGYETYCFKYDEESNQYILLAEIPTYEDILDGKYTEYKCEECPERTPFEKMKERLDAGDADGVISDMTKPEIALPAFNLWECFLDYSVEMPVGDYGMFTLLKDYGIRILSYGNHSGGTYSGSYRSFLIDVNGNTEFISFALSTYCTYAHPDDVRTLLVVAVDDDESAHHSLQMVLDENMIVHGDMCHFYHHGKIAVGNIGSGKVSELREFVKARCPELIEGNKFYLGSIKNNRLWYLNDSEVANVIKNLISYSLIRDKYRKYRKKTFKG